ncbi:phosphoribosylamine--glycine ligase, partial [Gluconacetobacter azotocaptans]
MRVLLVGSGGREHAMAAAIARSPLLEALFIAPGNPGTAALGTNVAIAADDVAGLVALARAERIDLVVPGPEAPLVAGLADACDEAGIACAGPTRAAAELEGSKSF